MVMVTRGLNKPIARVRGTPLFWLYQVKGSTWTCMQCHKRQEKGSVVFEMFVKNEGVSIDMKNPGNSGRHTGEKVYACLDCAQKLLEDAQTRVTMCKLYGPEGYAAMTDA